MARPKKYTAEFFPMFVKDGRTLVALQSIHGLEGVGFFLNLMRLLCSTPHHFLDLNDTADALYVAGKIGCSADEMISYVETMIMTHKLHRTLWEDHRVLFCDDLVGSLSVLYDKRKTDPSTAEDILNIVSVVENTHSDEVSDTETTPLNGVSDTETTHRREEDSRVEQSIDAPAVSDPVMIAYRTGIEEHLPAAAWPGTYKQHAALSELVEKTHEIAPDSAIPDPCEFATAVLEVFKLKKDTGKGEYWKGASWEPIVILRRFGDLVTGLSDVHDQSSRAEKEVEFMRRFHGEAN